MVGDSFTWGTHMLEEDAYPDRMATRLAKWHGPDRFEVINFSRPGWSTVRELNAVRRIPFLVVVFPIFDSQLDRRYKYDGLHSHLRKTADELGFDLLDLLPLYRGVDGRRLAVEPFVDAHPSELAHRIAADASLDRWIRRGVLPPPD